MQNILKKLATLIVAEKIEIALRSAAKKLLNDVEYLLESNVDDKEVWRILGRKIYKLKQHFPIAEQLERDIFEFIKYGNPRKLNSTIKTARVQLKSLPETTMLNLPERIKIGNFNIEISDKAVQNIELLKNTISIVTQKSAKKAPFILKNTPELRVFSDLNDDPLSSGFGEEGQYVRAYYDPVFHTITLFLEVPNINAVRLARSLIHELGHHVFQNILGAEARRVWNESLRADRSEINEAKILRLMDQYKIGHVEDLLPYLKETDPVLYLNLAYIADEKPEFATKEGIKDAMDVGLKLPNRPVTSYGNNSPEEAFCDFLSNYVVFGERTVDPFNLHLFKTITGGTILAEVEAAWGKEDSYFSETESILEAIRESTADDTHIPERQFDADGEEQHDANIQTIEGRRVTWSRDSHPVVWVDADKILFMRDNEWNFEHAKAVYEAMKQGQIFEVPGARVHKITKQEFEGSNKHSELGDLEEQYGMTQPWEKSDIGTVYAQLLDGNHRAAAAMLMGEKRIPVYIGEHYMKNVNEEDLL